MDGIQFPIGKKRDSKRQRRDYSGEKKHHLRKIILVTDSEGVVVAAVLNCPGSWGDSKCTDLGKLYDLIEQMVPDGCSVGADTAFKGGLLPPNKVIKILKAGEYAPDGMTEAQYKELEKLLTKACQPGEWINNVLVQSFRRLRQVLGIFDDQNSDMMEFTILVHNWRARTCCRNQVKKFFDILEKEEEIEIANGEYAAEELLTAAAGAGADDDSSDDEENDETGIVIL